ncbi:MAG: glycosyltransferase [Gammaproteobacteria bacterium]|nr:glycosyltransferase [Gammaproteobacteria bacterium]
MEQVHYLLLRWRLLGARYPQLAYLGACRHMQAADDTTGAAILKDAIARHVPVAAACPDPDRAVMVCGTLGGGGAERQIVNTALELQARANAQVTVLCQNLSVGSNDFFRQQLVDAGVSVAEVPRTPWSCAAGWRDRVSWRASGLGQHGLSDIVRIAAALREFAPSVVHAWLDEMNVKAGLAAAAAGVPRIVLGGRSVAPWRFAIYRPYLRHGYRLLCADPRVSLLNNSRAGAHDYARWLGVAPERIRVVRNGLALDELERPGADAVRRWRHAHGLPPGGPTVGGIMRFTEEKEPLLWVHAVAMVLESNPGAAAVLVGNGPLLARACRLAKRLGLADRIRFTGLVRGPAIAIAAMDVLLLSSRYEGLPNVVIEAQAMGVPAVVTRRGGSAEAIEAGVTGWAVDELTPAALAAPVNRILADSGWARAARGRAPDFVRERFALQRMLRETLQVYGETFRPAKSEAAGRGDV